jgi:hypothetical protein
LITWAPYPTLYGLIKWFPTYPKQPLFLHRQKWMT